MGKNIEFISANFNIVFKKLIEYKTNMYFLFGEHLIYRFSFLTFYYILFSNFTELINWTFNDFILFFIINDYLILIAGIFYWRKSLFVETISGQFNLYLVRPITIFLNYFFTRMSEEAIMYLITNTIINIFMIWYFKISISNILLGIFTFILILFIYISFANLFQSFEFKFKRIGTQLHRTYDNINHIFETYNSPYFLEFKFKKTLFFFFSFSVGYFLVSIFKNYYIPTINEYLILFSILIGIIIITWINWHFGLKKYEAFG